MNLKTTLIIVAVALFFCFGGVSAGIAAEKLTQDQITILSQEFQILQLQQQVMQQTADKNQKRMQEIAVILQPYMSDTKGVKAPAKKKGK